MIKVLFLSKKPILFSFFEIVYKQLNQNGVPIIFGWIPRMSRKYDFLELDRRTKDKPLYRKDNQKYNKPFF